MERRSSFSPVLLLLLTAIATMFACALPASIAPGSPSGGSNASLDIPEPAASLDQLSSYRGEVVVSFKGTRGGQPYEWTENWLVARTTDPQAYLVTLDMPGEEAPSTGGWLRGQVSGVAYARSGREAPCSAWVISEEDQPSELGEGGFNPLENLPPVSGASPVGAPEPVEGILSQHYRFDENAVDAAGVAKAAGDLWVAVDGGQLMKYSLRAEGGSEYFGQGVEGSMTWEYTLTQPNQLGEIPLPYDCPLGLIEVPTLPDATDTIVQPGFLGYLTSTDAPGAAAFYQERLPADGWQLAAEPRIMDENANLEYSKENKNLTILISPNGDRRSVWLVMEKAPDVSQPVETPGASSDIRTLVEESLNKLLGFGFEGSSESPLTSYRLEVRGSDTQWDPLLGHTVDTTYDLQADVTGSDLHLVHNSQRGEEAISTVEGYVLDGVEYEVVGGAVQPGIGNVAADWVLWPVNVNPALVFAALGMSTGGEEDVNGRVAQVFLLDSATAPEDLRKPVQDLTGYVVSRGTIWIDKQTGALLRLNLDYEVSLTNPGTRASQGTGTGHVEIDVSEVGATSVSLP